MPVLKYGSEILIWKEKGRSRIRAVHTENLRGLLVIMRINRVSNARIKKLEEG